MSILLFQNKLNFEERQSLTFSKKENILYISFFSHKLAFSYISLLVLNINQAYCSIEEPVLGQSIVYSKLQIKIGKSQQTSCSC